MKIGFSADFDGPGGARSWIKTFSNYCKHKGHDISYGLDLNVDVFCSVANISTVSDLKQLKERGIKILQRLGAIYLYYDHPSKVLIDRKNDLLKELTSYADAIVYQSKFSKEILFRSIYNGKEPDGDIIYNSTDASAFSRYGYKFSRSQDKILILAIAHWGTPHTSAKLIEIFLNIAKRFQGIDDVEFWVLGRATSQDEMFIKNANLSNISVINLTTPIDYNLMPYYLRTADLVLHLKANEGCSNLVIECIHTATPLVGLNTGSLPELVGDAALLAECTTDIEGFPDVNIDNLFNNIVITLIKRDYYQEKMHDRTKFFTLEETYEKYLNKLKKLCES
ncbi:MAG: hypothetical protein CVU84_12175 [Firmicutes bacterium HGW-Firmicutes-1]|jgi:glycosyltransferase involved in cell wall biosynthesis|nr:MAG: hypothetical protein CVU84_12175 [Firmicutes bacterium HGW-Firmicutes-1]